MSEKEKIPSAENEARAPWSPPHQMDGAGQWAIAGMQQSYANSMDEFVAWYGSAPRLSFNKEVETQMRNGGTGNFLAVHALDQPSQAGYQGIRLRSWTEGPRSSRTFRVFLY